MGYNTEFNGVYADFLRQFAELIGHLDEKENLKEAKRAIIPVNGYTTNGVESDVEPSFANRHMTEVLCDLHHKGKKNPDGTWEYRPRELRAVVSLYQEPYRVCDSCDLLELHDVPRSFAGAGETYQSGKQSAGGTNVLFQGQTEVELVCGGQSSCHSLGFRTCGHASVSVEKFVVTLQVGDRKFKPLWVFIRIAEKGVALRVKKAAHSHRDVTVIDNPPRAERLITQCTATPLLIQHCFVLNPRESVLLQPHVEQLIDAPRRA